MPESFWPPDIAETNLVTPAALMREQAALLGQMTNQQVTAEVVTQASAPSFTHSFLINVPGLDNYRFELFRVVHPITLYPVTVYWEGQGYSVPSQEAFLEMLKRILGSEGTKKVIKALLAQIVR